MLIIALFIGLALTMYVVNTGTATPRLDLLGPILEEAIDEKAYVANRVLPPIPVQKQAGAIPSFLLTDNQVLSIKHSPKTGYARIQSKLGEKTFSCKENGLEEPLSVEDYNILGQSVAEMAVARKLRHNVLRARDIALASSTLSAAGETAFSGQVTTGVAAWDNPSGVPFTDIETAKEAVAKRIGSEGNCLLIGRGALTKLRTNAQIRTAARNILGINDRKFVMSNLTDAQIAEVLGLDEIIVGGAVKNTADEGQADSLSFVWDSTYALLFKKSTGKSDVMEDGLGRTFVWDLAQTVGEWATGNVDAEMAMIIEQYREEKINANVLRCREYIDQVILNSKAAQLIKTI